MPRILVAGGFNEDNEVLLKEQQEFAKLLGEVIISQGHVLLNACMTSFDAAIAASAFSAAEKQGEDPNDRIVSYVLSGQELAHKLGRILQSQVPNWEIGNPDWRVPEPIQRADAVVLVGGFQGTFRAANWARFAKKPLLPVTRFGGTAAQVYSKELSDFDSRYGGRISKSDYENLSELESPLDTFARSVVDLAQKSRASRSVFVIMSFKEDLELEDTLQSYKDVCAEFKYVCERVDEASNVERILPEILRRISECAFTIVDLSVPSPNVYYELGYAEGQGKPCIVTAKGTEERIDLPFDAKDIPVISWKNQTGLRDALRKRVREIAEV
jgi:hypothetical protein